MNRKSPFFALFLLFPLLLGAQTAATRAPFIRATGEGVVTVKPDQARVSLGVNTQALTAEEASSRNAEISTILIAEVRKVIGSGGEIRTTGYSVSPVYRASNGQPSTIAGYSVTNSIEVVVNDTNLAGRVLDAGVRAGANQVNSVRFTLRDTQQARAQALRLATQQARAQADAIAQGLGARTGRVVSAADTTSSSGISSPVIAAGALTNFVVTPVESGTLEVRVTVTLEVEIVIL